jgi:glutamine synthetase adenylyltransferase
LFRLSRTTLLAKMLSTGLTVAEFSLMNVSRSSLQEELREMVAEVKEVIEEIVGTAHQEEMAEETQAESQEAEEDHLLATSALGVATPVIGR